MNTLSGVTTVIYTGNEVKSGTSKSRHTKMKRTMRKLRRKYDPLHNKLTK